MSNKMRIKVYPVESLNGPVQYNAHAQRRIKGQPWETVEVFSGEDKDSVLRLLTHKYPKARFR